MDAGGTTETPQAGLPPSGRQFTISYERQTALITEVGAALRRYHVDGRDLLDGYAQGEMCTGARGQSLIPWPNRIRDGRYTWKGQEEQLDLSEPEKGGAIHGLTRWANWEVERSSESSIAFVHTQHACQGWPWVLECHLEYSLDETGLTVRTTAVNRSSTPCPYGTGAHPYLTVGTPHIDPAQARVPGSVYLPVDEQGIPTGHRPVEGTPYDLREMQALGDRQIDVTYTELERDDDGRARVHLAHPDGSPGVALWSDEAYPYFEIFTGDTLPQEDRRRTGLGVEPMTCAPNAFNSGEGLVTLAPGESHTGTWGIEPVARGGRSA
ncbi:aldose 1-epimerase family protein [Sinomonas terrae]|uniref:Aldose 1-epimerase family protein n=1 Tax=Sinomonas terrae TaxID=2908838 RepID=A0ABS9U2M9_9MICC|nr:aldose 1-epimerase family protein [Sinomonas terrae]MCH6470831.1 aldose 1-epimerase family protein [Sinomonas terrae]